MPPTQCMINVEHCGRLRLDGLTSTDRKAIGGFKQMNTGKSAHAPDEPVGSIIASLAHRLFCLHQHDIGPQAIFSAG